MGHWHSFPELIIDRSTKRSFILEVNDDSWNNIYGRATATVISDGRSLIFELQGPGNEVYSVSYTMSPENNTHVEAVNHSVGNLIVETDTVTFNIYDRVYITQLKESTLSGSNPLKWEFKVFLANAATGEYNNIQVWVTPWDTTTTSTITRKPATQVNSPTIEVSFIPEGNFQDIASVTFSVKDDTKHGCAGGDYKQLLSSPNSDTRQIHVLAPLVSCHLAGEGDFSTEKMYSINKTVGPVWPEVFLYAMAKFILNRLLNGSFDMDILYRRNTKKFLKQLRSSKYFDFVQFFDQEQDKERYFLR